MRRRDRAIDQQRLGGAADAGAAHLGVEHDRLRHVERRGLVDIDVADAFEMREHRHPRFLLHARDQALAAARHDHVDGAVEAGEHHPDRGAVARRHQLDRVRRQAGLREPVDDRVVDGAVGALALGAAAQDRGIAGLEAERGGVGRHVRAALIDDADDAERHAHALDRHAVRPRPALGDLADRIGEIADHLDAGGHGGDALVVEREPVEEGRVGAAALGLGHVLGIGGEDRRPCAARIVSAMAASALSFCAVGASASTRAALRARCPISGITAAVSASTVLSGAVMAAFMADFLTRPPADCMPIGGLGYRVRKGQALPARARSSCPRGMCPM